MRLAILVIAALLVFGCLGGGQSGPVVNISGPQLPGGVQDIVEPPPVADECVPGYSFQPLQNGMLGHATNLEATVTCAAGKTITVKLDGEVATTARVEGNETTALNFELIPRKEGTVRVTAETGGSSLLSRDWTVAPLGSSDTKGLENDGISFKEWRAVGFEVDGQASIGRVRAYVKRIEAMTQPNTNIVVEIKSDNGGVPGTLLGSVIKPITTTTMSDNWINFDFTSPIDVQRGKYWVVFRIDQTENVNLISDTIYLHYVPVDKQAAGNDYTRQMILTVDPRTGIASETSWTPLSYDRYYSMTIHGVQ